MTPRSPSVCRMSCSSRDAFPPDEVSLYLATLVSQDPETWDALIEES